MCSLRLWSTSTDLIIGWRGCRFLLDFVSRKKTVHSKYDVELKNFFILNIWILCMKVKKFDLRKRSIIKWWCIWKITHIKVWFLYLDHQYQKCNGKRKCRDWSKLGLKLSNYFWLLSPDGMSIISGKSIDMFGWKLQLNSF